MSEVKRDNPSDEGIRLPLTAVSTFQEKAYLVNLPKVNRELMTEDELEEEEWNAIVSKPHVRRGLRRLAEEARRQIAAGETEEGGFAVE